MIKNQSTRTALLGLLLASSATPALTQETVTPPTITPPAATAPAETPAPAASPGITFAPQAPVVQQAPPPAPPPESVRNPAPEPRAAATRAEPRRATASARRATPATAAPAAAAPSIAPVAAAPAPAPSPEITPPPPAPVETEAAAPAPVAESGEVSSAAAWGMLGLFAAAILAGIAFLIARRRRRTAETWAYDEPVYEEEPAYIPVEQPAAVAPVAAPVAAVAAAAGEDAARPWIDIGLRPIRAGDDLSVEVTVSNSGDAPAHDVRVSTWMLDGAQSSAGEASLIDARSDAQVSTVSVAEGEDTSVDSRLAMPEDGRPILVAEARYPLPQGGEGRIAATFEIDGEGEAVEARLHEVVERA